MLGIDRERLRALPLFSSLSGGDLLMLSQLVEERKVAPGQRLTKQGERGNVFGIFESGAADVFVDGRLVRQLGAGDHFGEIALLGTGISTADVMATADGVLFAFRGRDFDEFSEDEPAVIEVLKKVMRERLDHASPQ